MIVKLYDVNEEWNAFSLKTRHVQSPLLFLIFPFRKKKSESFPRLRIPLQLFLVIYMTFGAKYEIES